MEGVYSEVFDEIPSNEVDAVTGTEHGKGWSFVEPIQSLWDDVYPT